MHPGNQQFVDQDPSELRLTLVERPIDRGLFSCLQTACFEHEGIGVEATVIGASHAIVFTAGAFSWNEVFACQEYGFPSEPMKEEVVVERSLPGFVYSFQAQLHPWTTDHEPRPLERIIRLANRQAESGEGCGLVQDFPKGDLGVAPKTVIVGRAFRSSLCGIEIQTAHAYPGKGLVMSRSSLVRQGS